MKLQIRTQVLRHSVRYSFGVMTTWFTDYDLYFGCYVNFLSWHCVFTIIGPKNINYI